MTPTELLIRLDFAGIAAFAVSLWLLYCSISIWLDRRRLVMKPFCPPELHLQIGIALLINALGVLMIFSMVRREVQMSGQNSWFFVESWHYAGIKAIAITGLIEVVRGLTIERYGRWVWLPLLLAIALVLLWPYPGPAHAIAGWLHRQIEMLR